MSGSSPQYIIETAGLNMVYRAGKVEVPALRNVNLAVQPGEFLAIMGPSGCGKSTVLRSLNRMNDPLPWVFTEGQVRVDGVNVYAPDTDVIELRRKVGMVFQVPNPFPMVSATCAVRSFP
jgi:phosphate transport system ATP-binding protein